MWTGFSPNRHVCLSPPVVCWESFMRIDWSTIAVLCLCLAACRKKPPPAPEPGRAAIDRALDRLYPGAVDHPMALKPAAGEKEPPLEEVVAYRLAKPSPHWLYVTYGLSDIGAKTNDDKNVSGFGIEL